MENIDDDFVETELSSERGHATSNPGSLLYDEEFRLQARQYVHENACKTGEPNMTVKQFHEWVMAKFQVKICEETARFWLHHIGFSQKNHQKGVYFDGHDRQDVSDYREKFVKQMEELDKKSIIPGHPSPQVNDGE